MKAGYKEIGRILLVVFLTLWAMETVFYIITPAQYKKIGYLVNFKRAQTKIAPPGFGFNEIDPLLGYAKTPDTLMAQGFKLAYNGMLLTTTHDTTGCLNILITGGSTSDLSLYPNNWPVELCSILKEHHIKARLYCAGVGGYNSGQELLKLIRDGLEVGPWLHISYSGANEFNNPSYVSNFEKAFYETEFDQAPTTWLLPNTVMFMRDLLKMNHPGLQLRQNQAMPSPEFWEKNMHLMHGIAVENKYHFVGFLQPVLGSGQYTQPMPDPQQAIEAYRKQYPQFRKAVKRDTAFMVDLSAIFDSCQGKVYMDNCHIYEPYQQVVAMNIYDALVEKKLLER